MGAVLDIVRERTPETMNLPGAAEVAARAGVSERTVFRHFADLDSLFMAAAAKQRPAHETYVGPRPDAPDVVARITALVRLRSKLYEEIAPVRRVAIHLSHTRPVVLEQLGRPTRRREPRSPTSSPRSCRVRRREAADAPARRARPRPELGDLGHIAYEPGLLGGPGQESDRRAHAPRCSPRCQRPSVAEPDRFRDMTMPYRRLGRSGLKVSLLSFGSWVTFGPQLDDDLATRCLEAARRGRGQLLRQRRVLRRGPVRGDHGPGVQEARVGTL